MQLYSSGLETHPDGSANINPIVNGNWTALDAMFNPAEGMTASQSGTTVTASAAVFESWDVGSLIVFADLTTDTISAVTDSTHATVGVSRTVGSQAFWVMKSSESQKGSLLRGLMGVTQMNPTAHDGRLLYIDEADEKLRALDSLTYTPGTDFTFEEPVVIDDDAGAVSTEAMLTVRRNMDATSGYNWAFVVAATVENTTASTANPSAGYFTINTTNATANIATAGGGRPGVCGLYVNPGHSNATYTLDMLQGMFIYCSHSSGAANLAEMNGIQIYMDCAAASTCDLVRALYIPTIQRSGGADAWWAIYQSGPSDNSYLAGKLIISDLDTGADETFSTDRLHVHAEGTYGATSKSAVNIDMQSTYSSGSASAHVNALFVKTDHTGSGTMSGSDGLSGIYAWVESNSTAATSHAGAIMGAYVRAGVGASSGNATYASVAALRVRVENQKSGATITNAYGLYILAPITTGTITNLYGIYQAGTGVNYFTGNVHMGTTNRPSSLVSGLVMATGTAATGTVSAGDVAIWFDGSNLRMRIGTTDYTITKT